MSVFSIDEARQRLSSLQGGDEVIFTDEKGNFLRGTVRIKAVRCGRKGCSKCPHEKYAYAQCRVGPKVKEKYIGKVR